jgi:hypothetical protein
MMRALSRRQFVQMGITGLGTLALPRWGWGAPASGEKHYFLQIFLPNGADPSYMFDARPLAMTKAGKIQNYLGEDPQLLAGTNGTSCYATSLVQPLIELKDRFSIINGVLMSPFDGHDQNTNQYFTGSPFGGGSFIPELNLASSGQGAASLDVIQNGVYGASITNDVKTVLLTPASAGPLASRLQSISATGAQAQLNGYLRERFAAASVGKGLFAKASGNMLEGFDRMGTLREQMVHLTSPDPALDQETQFVRFLSGIFQNNVARSALLVLIPNTGHGSFDTFDTHSYDQAVNQPRVFADAVARLTRLIKGLSDVPFDGQRSMLDVTTFVVNSEFARTMRQAGNSVERTGTDHNQFNNSILIGGKGIRSGQIIGQSDLRAADEKPSGAHLQADPGLIKAIGKPFDFSACKPRTDLPGAFAEADYLNIGSVINTVYDLFAVPKAKRRALTNGSQAPSLRALLK